jgi:hypothetical protein
VWSPKLDPCFAGFKLSIVGFLWGLSTKTIEREEREKKIERERQAGFNLLTKTSLFTTPFLLFFSTQQFHHLQKH